MFALILTHRNRNAIFQLVKIDHEYNEMADTVGGIAVEPDSLPGVEGCGS
jgi:hypothetical protein